MKFRDPQREQVIEDKQLQKESNKRDAVEDLRKKTFNLINHEGPPRKIDLMQRPTKEMLAPRSYNYLTNLSHRQHDQAPTLFDEQFYLTNLQSSINRSKLERGKTTVGRSREFNIVSNQFFEHPEQKKQEEYEKMKSHVLKKYWETHDYDMVKGQYYSGEKEEMYQTQRKIVGEVQGKFQETRIPPSILYSDGQSYNILTHDVYDDDRLEANMTMATRKLNRMKKREVEAGQRAKGEDQYLQGEVLRMNRIKYTRWQTEMDRGYNPIKNEVVNDPPSPLPDRPVTMWSRLATSQEGNELHHSNNNNNNQNELGYSQRYHHKYPALFNKNATLLPGENATKMTKQNYNQFDNYKGFEATEGGNNATSRIRNLSGNGPRYVHSGGDGGVSVPLENIQNQASHNHFPSARTGGFGNTQPNSGRSLHEASQLSTRRETEREGMGMMSKRENSKSVPNLDLGKAEYGEPVTYKVPDKAPPGFAVSMVRTGGFGAK